MNYYYRLLNRQEFVLPPVCRVARGTRIAHAGLLSAPKVPGQ